MRRPARRDPAARAHEQWLGAVQPEGLVLSVPVLVDRVVLARQPVEAQVALRTLCPDLRLPDLATFWRVADRVLSWPADRLDPAPAARWAHDLPEVGVRLAPDAAVCDAQGAPILWVCWTADDPDAPPGTDRWTATAQDRVERLLLELQRPADGGPAGPAVALHVFPDGVRLVYAPLGAAAGHLTFPLLALMTADGRDVLDAFVAVLGRGRVFSGGAETRLPALLAESRLRQAEVTTTLAGQVEQALRALLAGLDAADARSGGRVLGELRGEAGRAHLYEGLVTTLLRVLFLLFAEDRGLLPLDHPVYAEHYSVSALADRLLDDRLAHPQAMDRRFGAWSRLLALFRLLYAGEPALGLPARHGELFDPDGYPFLEGRAWQGRSDWGSNAWQQGPAEVPPVDDATVAEVLLSLVYLGGQRLSYRALSEEELGSMYEALMGFELRRAGSPAVPVGPRVWVELQELREAADPLTWLAAHLGERVPKLRARVPALAEFEATGDRAADHARLRAALAPLRPEGAAEVPADGHYLQAGEARRRSGSHYTPRSLTEEVVRHALDPLLRPTGPDGRPGPSLNAEGILALRLCDPAMGSGAFLVQAVRHLGQALGEAWARTGSTPAEAGDRADLYARRLVAERCVYGVDLNPLAVRLAKLSLWLVTLARDLPFTFVDHALCEGDALTGADLRHVNNWSLPPRVLEALPLVREEEVARLGGSAALRKVLVHLSNFDEKRRLTDQARAEAAPWRAAADALVGVYAAGLGKRDRETALLGLRALDLAGRGRLDPHHPEVARWRAHLPTPPFHWQVEFPEVFGDGHGGFDAVLGNPPFGGKNTTLAAHGDGYLKLLQALRPHAHGNADLSAHFFLRAAEILRPGGLFGLIATNTISQGDTRETGLQYLVQRGVSLGRARTDLKWEAGGAAVTVSVVHGARGPWRGPRWLDGAPVAALNSALSAEEEWGDPQPLAANAGRAFVGSYVLGMGFVLTPAERAELLALDARNAEVIFPYLGGKELNSRVDDTPERYVIDFRDWPLEQAQTYAAPFERVERLVKPERDVQKRDALRERWWKYAEWRPGLLAALAETDACLLWSRVSKHLLISRMSVGTVFAETTIVFPGGTWADFAALQSTVHEAWARELSSSLKTDLRYTPSSCFETFPFPPAAAQAELAAVGEAFHQARDAYRRLAQVGLTELTNRLTDATHPLHLDPAVVALRARREALDRAALAAYGWADLAPDDAAEIVRRLRALNAERHREEKA